MEIGEYICTVGLAHWEKKIAAMKLHEEGSIERQKEMGSVHSEQEKWIKHYSSSHKILLVGEGDLSFAACLGRAFGSAAKIVATSYDSNENALLQKYSSAKAHLEELKNLQCEIIYGVDATTMSQDGKIPEPWSFDRVVFNFPFAFASSTSNKRHVDQIELHQKLIKGFFSNAKDMLAEGGEVHVTHKTSPPYRRWRTKKLATDCGLRLVAIDKFSEEDYPGYHMKRTHIKRAGVKKFTRPFKIYPSTTFKFREIKKSP